MQKQKTFFGLAAIFFVAILFRLWITHLVPQPFIFDQTEYEYYAQKIFSAPFMLAAHTYRSYPYPLMLAYIYKVVGFGNHSVIFAVQAVLDSFTGLLIFFILRLVGKSRAAWIGFILYSVNPLTAAYTGVILSETLSTFLIAATLFTGLLLIKKPSIYMGLLFGMIAGMSVQTRNAMLTASVVIVGSMWFWISWKAHKRVYLAIFIGLILTVLYPLYTNWVAYHEITIFKVDSFYAIELFNGATLKILPPFTTALPLQQQIMFNEYWSEYSPTRTAADRQAMAKKYFDKAIAVIRADPVDYIHWRFYKMWHVWQKENIYSYSEPGFESHRQITFWGNTVLLALAFMGIVFTFMRQRKRRFSWLLIVSVGTLALQTFALCFSFAEYRLSIPLYPIIFLYAAYALDTLPIVL
jgi:hypothetical protein